MFLLGFILTLCCMNSDAYSEILFVYNGTCFATCPRNTINIEGTNQCVDECPESSPVLSSRHTCVKYCPLGYVLDELTKTCIEDKEYNLLTNQPTRKQDEYYYVNCYCPSFRPFCYKLRCYKDCPKNTKLITINGQHCVDYCPDTNPFTNNDTCTTKCPDENIFNFRKTCLSSCPKPLYTNNTTCVETCPSGLVSHEYVCHKQCPTSSPYVLESEAGNVCKEECPATTHIMGYRCKAECPKKQPYLFNRTCVSSCPNDAPYGMQLKVYNISKLICLPSCPYDRVRDGMFCFEQCRSDMAVFRKLCVELCPNNTYVYHARGTKECVAQCPSSHKFAFEGECLTWCPIGTNRINLTETCVRNCSTTDHPFTYKTSLSDVGICVKDCPHETFYHNFQCVLACPNSYQYVDNRTCHDACPTSLYKYEKDVWWYYYEYKLCVPYCPQDWFKDGHECVSKCKTSFFANETCVSECPPEMPYSIHKYMFETTPQGCRYNCPSGMYANGHICVPSCPFQQRYVLDGECLEKCPMSYPFYNKTYGCKKSCDLDQIADGFECGYSCPLSKRVQNNGTCEETCPQNFPYVQSTNKGNECRNQCTDGYFLTEDNECVSKCWTDKKQYTLHNKCYKKCPDSHQYHLNVSYFFYYDKDMFYCSKKCESNTLALNFSFTCIPPGECDINIGMFEFDGKCVPHCPSDSIQIYNYKWCVKIDGITSNSLLVLLLLCPILGVALCLYWCKLKDVKYMMELLSKRQKLTITEEETCLLEPFHKECADNNESTETMTNDQSRRSTTDDDETCLMMPYSEEGNNNESTATLPNEQRQNLTADEEETCLLKLYTGEYTNDNGNTQSMSIDQKRTSTTDGEETCLLMLYSEEGTSNNESSETLQNKQKQSLTTSENETCLLVPYSGDNTDINEGRETRPNDQIRHPNTLSDERKRTRSCI